MSTFQAPYKAVLVSLYEYAIQSENEKLCGKIKEVFDLQFDDLPNRFRRLGLNDNLICPSYVINTSFLQENSQTGPNLVMMQIMRKTISPVVMVPFLIY